MATDQTLFTGSADEAQDVYLHWLDVLKAVYQCARPFYIYEYACNGPMLERAQIDIAYKVA
ncbi:MAG: hypothetical protein ACRDF4_08785 [Rhabdochlamydiaceae bacterium]